MPASTPSSDGLSERIAPHLPLLRRYARAVTGSQASGDAYVAALLEALIVDRSLIDQDLAPRVALYAAFQRLWESASAGAEPAAEIPETPGAAISGGREAVAHERLSRLTPRSRQALILTAVEGFGHDEAATIMGGDAGEIATLVAGAIADLEKQTRARVLIIEDEPIIAMDIEQIVVDLGHKVVATADTRDRAVQAASTHEPDLILADIQLADGSSGIDAAADILKSFSVPVIFITAYPDRLLTGARPEPTFLISKPFRTETVQAAISQALFFRETVEMA